jgi:cytidylate kinase
MDNILLKYMIERAREAKEEKKAEKGALPFITISREFGCSARHISALIIKKINEDTKIKQPWRIVSKEILDEAAKELHIDKERVKQIFSMEERSFLDQILDSFYDKYYVSDKKISKTVSAVIEDFAKSGNVVIIGRGGVNITKDLPKGFHVRVVAPLEWRIDRLVEKGICKTARKAKALAKEMDFKRNVLLNTKKVQAVTMPVFDITFNAKFFKPEEIADSVIAFMKIKGLL